MGRVATPGPVFDDGGDARSQAQDAFPTELHPGVTPGTGEHFRPTTDRFGTAAFSAGADLATDMSPNVVTGDSVWIAARDMRGAGGVTSVEWFGAIVAGPHRGQAPPPWVVGANGFFHVVADSARDPLTGSVVEDRFFVDLDDFYFRGGDVVHYFWLARDALGGTSSHPFGLVAEPVSIEAAQRATDGMLEVSTLPSIEWDPTYLASVDADDHGDIQPTAEQMAASVQSNCILYVNLINPQRRSGDVNRTSFMWTLDVLGYTGTLRRLRPHGVRRHEQSPRRTCHA